MSVWLFAVFYGFRGRKGSFCRRCPPGLPQICRRRYYRPDDVELLALIKELLYERRYTIEGVQKLFKNRSLKDILGTEIQKDFFEDDEPAAEQSSAAEAVQEVVRAAAAELSEISRELKKLAAE